MAQKIIGQKVETEGLKKKLGFFAKTSPWIIIPMDVVAILVLLYIGATKFDINLINYSWVLFLGFFFWTLLEYLMHRYAFHFDAKNEKGKQTVYLLHGIHHEFPTHPDKLYQPPIVNLILIIGLLGFFAIFMQKYTFVFMPGVILGYLAYSSIHFIIHNFKPPFEFLKPLWRHHNMHHYRHQDKAFGVSSPFWDFVFGTLPPKSIDDKDI